METATPECVLKKIQRAGNVAIMRATFNMGPDPNATEPWRPSSASVPGS